MIATPRTARSFIEDVTSTAPLPFDQLIAKAGLDPALHLSFEDWSGLSFRDCDLRDFDFSGARVIGCDFTGALIAGAHFDEAEIDVARPYATLDPGRTNIRSAKDWDAYVKTWTRVAKVPVNDHLPVGAVFQDAPFAPELVVVPAGAFMLGAPDSLGGDRKSVTIAQPFAVGRFPVTFDEWIVFAEATGRGVPDDNGFGRGRRPVINVSWDDAQLYLSWLSVATGRTFQLLSEAKWEYCCRAGTETAYSTGERITKEQAHFQAKATVEVGTFPSNVWGLYDMHGNVWEWCQDEWCEDYNVTPDDGSAQQENFQGGLRVVRGGSWSGNPRYLRSAYRLRDSSNYRSPAHGLRIGRALLTS